MTQRVVVVGGGYGGVAVARALDDVADVVLVEPKDAFVHSAAALRATVDPQWQEHVFFPYDKVLTRGTVRHDRARAVSPGLVRLSATDAIEADHVVLATGAAYPFPAKFHEDAVRLAAGRLERTRADLSTCTRVLVVGAGPSGIELTGELTAAFPAVAVTIVEKEEDILPGDYLPALRDGIRAQLAQRDVTVLTGTTLSSLPPSDVGAYQPFRVTTSAGTVIEAEMWFRCHGSRPVTDYLEGQLREQLRGDGRIHVTEHLNVVGQDRVWAVGDITDVPESKRATAARAHAAVVAQNIRDVIEGREPSAVYTPAPELVVLALGPDAGAAQVARPDGTREVLGPDETSEIKGGDLFADAIAELVGVEPD